VETKSRKREPARGRAATTYGDAQQCTLGFLPGVQASNGRTALSRACLVSIAAELVADVRTRLVSFASLGIAPWDWHPFLCYVSDRVVMNGPSGVTSSHRIARVVKGASACVSRARRLPWWGGPCLARPTDVLFVTVTAPLAPVF
jgi:hypothetical protein